MVSFTARSRPLPLRPLLLPPSARSLHELGAGPALLVLLLQGKAQATCLSRARGPSAGSTAGARDPGRIHTKGVASKRANLYLQSSSTAPIPGGAAAAAGPPPPVAAWPLPRGASSLQEWSSPRGAP